MKKLFCMHDWKPSGQQEHVKYNRDCTEVVKSVYCCTKCNKKKYIKMVGHHVGKSFVGSSVGTLENV